MTNAQMQDLARLVQISKETKELVESLSQIVERFVRIIKVLDDDCLACQTNRTSRLTMLRPIGLGLLRWVKRVYSLLELITFTLDLRNDLLRIKSKLA
jgi:hypothetical protein